MKYAVLALPLILTMTACGQDERPTAEAVPVPVAEPASMLPGTGPVSFVGRWAADVSWCANTTGPQQPIDITPLRFDGYENRCAITRISQIPAGYEADLSCASEGTVRGDRVRMQVEGQTMTLTYPDRGGAPVELLKCTSLTDTAASKPMLPIGPG